MPTLHPVRPILATKPASSPIGQVEPTHSSRPVPRRSTSRWFASRGRDYSSSRTRHGYSGTRGILNASASGALTDDSAVEGRLRAKSSWSRTLRPNLHQLATFGAGTITHVRIIASPPDSGMTVCEKLSTVHFCPKGWSIEVEFIRDAARDVLDVIDLIEQDDWPFRHMEDGTAHVCVRRFPNCAFCSPSPEDRDPYEVAG